MDKFKKIVCISGVVVLVAIYIFALVAAIFVKENSTGYFMAAIYSTVVIPALMYAMLLMHKIFSKMSDENKAEDAEGDKEINE